jgi:hypothetical protein
VACISVTLCDLGHNRKLHDQSQDVFACHVAESLHAKLAQAVFLFRGGPARAPVLEAMGATAKALGVELRPVELDRLTDLEGAFSALADQQISGLVVQDHAFFLANADAIAVLARADEVIE